MNAPSRLPGPGWAQRLRAAWQSAWHGLRTGQTPGQIDAPSMAAHPSAGAPDTARSSTARDLLAVLERSSDYVVQTDTRGAITYLNPAARAAIGLSAEGPLGELNFNGFATPATQRLFAEEVGPILAERGVWVGETVMNLGDRRDVPFSHMALAHRGPDGKLHRFSAVMREISDQVAARQATDRHHQILAAITEAIPATVVIVDSQGRYRFVNSAFERYAGKPAAEILGHTAMDVLGAEEVLRRKPYMIRAFGGEAVSFTLDYPGPEGTTYLAFNCIPLKLDGLVDGFVGLSQDITAHRREQDRLAELAERDPLTGLLNRAGLEQRLAAKVAAGDADHLALLYIDLDHFKPVNDQYGHGTGDELLKMFGQRVTRTVRTSDLVVRLGGDEFAVLLSGVPDLATARAVGDKVLAAANQPFLIDGRAVHVSASIGVAQGGAGGAELATLMAEADALLYRAKAGGRSRVATQEGASDLPA